MIRYELSHWEWESFFKDLDVLIVGSGIVGLSAAIRLKEEQPALKIVVADRGPLPIGASTRNAGFACFGSISELLDDLQHSSRKEVIALVAQRYQGLQRLRQRYGDEAIGYRAWGGYELFRADEQESYNHCRAAMQGFNQELRQFIVDANHNWPSPNKKTPPADIFVSADEQLASTGLQHIQHLLLNRAEGQLNTGLLMRTLLDRAQSLGIRCLGGIAITQMEESAERVYLQTDQGWELQARKVIIATNGFAQQLLPQLAVQPARNQVLITAPLPGLRLQGCYHYHKGYVYFRNVGDRLLLGGGRHLDPSGETTAELGKHQDIRDYLTSLLQEYILPNQAVKIERWWSGIMGIGQQKKPIIESLSKHSVVAVRLGGMGVAIGTQVGERAADIVLETI